MEYQKTRELLARTGLDISYSIAEKINSIPRTERVGKMESVLKSGEESRWAKKSDVIAERIGMDYLKTLSENLETKIIMVVSPKDGKTYEIGNYTKNKPIYCEHDSIDGTSILDGVGNENGIYRIGSNGHYGTSTAFTMPTEKDFSKVTIDDFEVSAMIEANPPVYRNHPVNAVAYKKDERLQTFEWDKETNKYHKLGMSSQENFSQSALVLDSLQAFDRFSNNLEMEQLAYDTYKVLSNRNEGGAFDVTRTYARVSDLLGELFERKEGNIQPRATALVCINDNIGNMVSMTSVVKGTGGHVVDFDGNDIGKKKIVDNRQHIVVASNEKIKDHILSKIKSI